MREKDGGDTTGASAGRSGSDLGVCDESGPPRDLDQPDGCRYIYKYIHILNHRLKESCRTGSPSSSATASVTISSIAVAAE